MTSGDSALGVSKSSSLSAALARDDVGESCRLSLASLLSVICSYVPESFRRGCRVPRPPLTRSRTMHQMFRSHGTPEPVNGSKINGGMERDVLAAYLTHTNEYSLNVHNIWICDGLFHAKSTRTFLKTPETQLNSTPPFELQIVTDFFSVPLRWPTLISGYGKPDDIKQCIPGTCTLAYEF